MKLSRRALRMERHYKRNKNRGSLNMISLMDIFTILVFFLLVTAQNSEVLPSPKRLKLPDAYAEKIPKENIVIMVNDTDILVQGKKVAATQTAIRQKSPIIQPLLGELNATAATKKTRWRSEKDVKKQGITIMGDKKIPYILLKKIMITCASTEFTKISLAVVKKLPPAEK